ncbi:hypothetical protein MMC10_008823 [Thelotrema lepadinum]|nr:hypothetical protein [Thelotrema lepadinum]
MPSLLSSLSALALIPLAFTAPLNARSSGPVTLTAVAASKTLNKVPITASHGSFYIGVPNAPCTLPAPQCSQYANTTAVSFNSLSSTAGMFSTVESHVYVAPNGVLSFTAPGKENTFPDGALKGPFDTEEGKMLFTGGDSPGFVACPVGSDGGLPYVVMALVDSMGASCAAGEKITIATTQTTTLGAYAYN